MGTTTAAPKLTKAQQKLVDRAVELGLDVDPANYDPKALKHGVAIAERIAKLQPGDTVAVFGFHNGQPESEPFTGGLVISPTTLAEQTTHSHLRIENGQTRTTEEVPVELISSIEVETEAHDFDPQEEMQRDAAERGQTEGQRKAEDAANAGHTGPPEPEHFGSRADELLEGLKLTPASIAAVYKATGLTPDSETTPEALERFGNLGSKEGLRGKALGIWVLTGSSSGELDKPAPKKPAAPASSGPREGSTLAACITVLRHARKPLKASEVYDKIAAQKLAPGLKGKTPGQTVAAQLNVAAAKGKHGIHRPEPGRFAIKKDA